MKHETIKVFQCLDGHIIPEAHIFRKASEWLKQKKYVINQLQFLIILFTCLDFAWNIMEDDSTKNNIL